MYTLNNIKQVVLNKSAGIGRQAGATLIELLIALALSLIVTSSMVVLMGNSMGSATRIIEMSQLTDELRNSMSMMSRDVRRANYNVNAIYCFANSECGEGANGSAVQADNITLSGDELLDRCMVFGLDRDWDGNADNDGGGAFRLKQENGVGRIEMWVATDSNPVCASNVTEGWVSITDPSFVNITFFNVDDSAAVGSYTTDLGASGGATSRQYVRYVQMQIDGELLMDSTISRSIVDTVNVRNDYYESL
ncbi:prepilin-type N-terminal cleavage/methylation domain-containing protein [Pseudomonadota bacterium]